MKLATLNDGTRDGRLIVVKRDNSAYALATHVAPTLQAALDAWDEAEPRLRALAEELEAGRVQSRPVDVRALLSPLPRAYEWVDGTAYLNHVILVRKARNAEPPPTLRTDPLVYQGGSGTFLAPTQDIPLHDESWGMDFESEVAVVLGDVPLGTQAKDAAKYVSLVMLCNDVTLRNLIPDELAKGFGFFQGKPSSAFSPFALTPDELGPAWKDGRVHLRLRLHAQRQAGGRHRRRSGDALLLLRSPPAHLQDAHLHRRHHPRQRHRLQRGPRPRHLVPRRAPDDRDHRDAARRRRPS